MKTTSFLLSVLAISIVFAGCGKRSFDPKIHLALEFFRSCDAVKEYMEDRIDEANDGQSDSDRVPLSGTSSQEASGAPSEHGTNLQEPGVDESDTVKLAGNRLYVARQNRLEIVDTGTLATTGSIDLDSSSGTKLFIDGGRLVTVTQSYDNVRIGVYERTDSPKLLYETKYRGFTQAMRMKDGKLYLVVSDYLVEAYSRALIAQSSGVPCQQILRPLVSDTDFSLMKVVALNTRADSLSVKSVAILGSGSTVYMSDKHLFVGKHGYSSGSYFLLTQIDIGEEGPVPSAVGKVQGAPNNERALKEKDGYLAVATSSWSEGNRLNVLKAKDGILEEVGATENFAAGESLYAVRYEGNFAYAITFRQIDPLWIIDWSNPLAPKITGELEVPGFSTYLHPASGGKLIGIGQSATRTQELSLFDVSDPTKPRRTATLELGGWSIAGYDPHAFFYRDELSLIGVPVYGEQSGVSLVRIQGSSLAEEASLSHESLRPAKCAQEPNDVERLFRVGDRIIAVSGIGLSAHPVSSPGSTAASRAMDAAGGCRLSEQQGFCGTMF